MPQACLTSDMVRLMGLTAESLDKVVYWHDGQCADFHGLPGVDIRPDTGAGVLRINMPQAWRSILMPPGCLPHAGTTAFPD